MELQMSTTTNNVGDSFALSGQTLFLRLSAIVFTLEVLCSNLKTDSAL